MVVAGEPAWAELGHKAPEIAGVVEFTVRFTAMDWLRFAAATPEATMVTFPAYAAFCGARLLASTDKVSVLGAPGSTYPLAGDTDSHGAPATVAVYETGPAVVDSTTVSVDTAGGAVIGTIVRLSPRFESGWATTSVTGTVTPGVPAAATTTFA